MLSLVSLVFTAVSVGIVIFQVINKNIIDIIDQYAGRFEPSALKFAISALVIAAPIYYVLQRLIRKNLFSGALDKEAGVRKWLTYFILLVSAVVMIFWLIFTLNSFLDGDLTLKFILKAITAIGIAAIIFSFYLYDIRREEIVGKKDRVVTYYFYGSLALVAIAFVFAVFNVESPRETRLRKLDEMVLQHFDQITYALDRFYNENSQLPKALEALKDDYEFDTEKTLFDPETKAPYEYRLLEGKKFELCAVFRLSNKDAEGLANQYMKDRWPHDEGRVCFERKASDLNAGKPISEIRPMPVE
jgi:hypothetical protein